RSFPALPETHGPRQRWARPRPASGGGACRARGNVPPPRRPPGPAAGLLHAAPSLSLTEGLGGRATDGDVLALHGGDQRLPSRGVADLRESLHRGIPYVGAGILEQRLEL